ncbi:transposase [Lactovum odontotermitis]
MEPTFEDIKQNMNFTRFQVRGQEKVSIEMGLVFMAHNFGN